jgi:hypothetical protein
MTNIQESVISQEEDQIKIVEKKIGFQDGFFVKFNNGLNYYLKNIIRLIWTLTKFFIFIMGVGLIVFPFILFGMVIVSPSYSVEVVKALGEILETLIIVFQQGTSG